MLLRKHIVGTVAYLGGLPANLEEFTWSWGNLLLHTQEYLPPGQLIHPDRATVSEHSQARNLLVERFLSGNFGEWLFMTDTDHSFDPDLILRMRAALEQFQLEVVSGLYVYRSEPHLPVAYRWLDDAGEDGGFLPIGGFEGIEPVQPVPVDCTGAGCLMVRRRVFERIRAELEESPFDKRHPWSEDFSFFLRLKQLGIQPFLVPAIESHHLQVRRLSFSDCDASGLPRVYTG